MAKVGISQGNPLAALGNILRKGPNRGSGRDSKSPRREHPVTKKSSFKGSKESLRDAGKDTPELKRHTSEPKSPKMFRFGIRRSSSRSKKGEKDDSASDTSSVNSLIFSVKEGPMEAESSGLTVSRSAVENGEKDDHQEKSAIDEATVSIIDTSKSGNRNSTYFKPPDVEPLSDLFASGELDALLKTNENATPTESMEIEEVEKTEKEEDMEEQTSGGSGLKRNNLRSSFRMYENRYRAETLERKKDKSPLSSSVSVASENPLDGPKAVQSSSLSEQQLLTSTPNTTENQSRASSDGYGTIWNVSSVSVRAVETKSQTPEESCSEEKQGNERRRKLFDDDLFQSDHATRAQSRPKKTFATAPSLDAYAQAHKSPPPVTKDKKESDEDLFVESVAIMSNTQSMKTTKEKFPSVENKQVSIAREELHTLHTTNNTCEVAEKADQPPLSRDVAVVTEKADQTPPSSIPGSVETALSKIPNERNSVCSIEETELERESEKREADKNAKQTDCEILYVEKATIEGDSPSPERTLHAVDKEESIEKAGNCTSDVKTSQEKTQPDKEESLNERVANRIRKRREEREEQRSSRVTRSYDSRSKIKSGKVSGARSMFDSNSPSASPTVAKTRASTESSRLATERRITAGTHGASPSLGSDLQKRREQRANKAKEKSPTKVKASTEDGEEDMPDWRKRIYERRRKAAEASAKGSSLASQSGQFNPSPRLGRHRDRVSARIDKSPQKNLGSDVTKSLSPSRSKNKTATSTTEEHTETVRAKTESEETDSKGAMEATHSQEDEKLFLHPDSGSDAPPELTSEIAAISSPKPEITFPKPDKKLEKPGSSECLDDRMSPIDTKPPTSKRELQQSKEKRGAEEEESFAPDTKKEITPENKDLPSSPTTASNLTSKVLADSHVSVGSRRSSNSSEQEVGVPFRSQSMSHSRSPTPTSHTPGPLKLSTDPGVPEWKKRMLERKKNSSSSRKPEPISKMSEPVVPAWKKELLAKKSKSGEEVLMYMYACVCFFTLVRGHHVFTCMVLFVL